MDPFFFPHVPRERFAVEFPPSFPPPYLQTVYGPEPQFRSPAIEAVSRAIANTRRIQMLGEINGAVQPDPTDGAIVYQAQPPATDFQSTDFRDIMGDLRQCRGMLDTTTRNLHSYMCTSMADMTQHRVLVEQRLFGLEFENARLREGLRVSNIPTESPDLPQELNQIFVGRWNSLVGTLNRVQDDRMKMNSEIDVLHELIKDKQDREAQIHHQGNLPHIPPDQGHLRDYGFLERPPNLGQIQFQPFMQPPFFAISHGLGVGGQPAGFENDPSMIVDDRPRPPQQVCPWCLQPGCGNCSQGQEATKPPSENSNEYCNCEVCTRGFAEANPQLPDHNPQDFNYSSEENELPQHDNEESNQQSDGESCAPPDEDSKEPSADESNQSSEEENQSSEDEEENQSSEEEGGEGSGEDSGQGSTDEESPDSTKDSGQGSPDDEDPSSEDADDGSEDEESHNSAEESKYADASVQVDETSQSSLEDQSDESTVEQSTQTSTQQPNLGPEQENEKPTSTSGSVHAPFSFKRSISSSDDEDDDKLRKKLKSYEKVMKKVLDGLEEVEEAADDLEEELDDLGEEVNNLEEQVEDLVEQLGGDEEVEEEDEEDEADEEDEDDEEESQQPPVGGNEVPMNVDGNQAGNPNEDSSSSESDSDRWKSVFSDSDTDGQESETSSDEY